MTVYALFLYDSRVREGAWEHLDDAVYYVKSMGNTVEFCFAVFLFFNGGWILLFESGGTIRALMMLIHAYCNIWCEAKSGTIINVRESESHFSDIIIWKLRIMPFSIYFELYLLGWATFVKRRSAVQKINALPDATAEQLALNDDV